MADVAVPFDVDSAADMYVDFDERTVGATVVRVPKTVLVDGATNNKAAVSPSGGLKVEIQNSPANGLDVHSRGGGGTASSVNVTASSGTLLAAGTTRRTVWFTSKAAPGSAAVVWIRPGGGTAVVGEGIPLVAGATAILDGSPNAGFTAISDGASVAVAIAIEAD